MKNGKFRKSFGLILLILQLVSIAGLFLFGGGFFHPVDYEITDELTYSRYNVDTDDLIPEYSLTAEDAALSYVVGTEKLAVSLECLYDHIISGDVESAVSWRATYPFTFRGAYVTAHEPQFLMMHRSLEAYSPVSAFLHSAACLIGYLLPGILGIFLLIKGNSFSSFPVAPATLQDMPFPKRDRWLKPVGILVSLVCALLLFAETVFDMDRMEVDLDRAGDYIGSLFQLDRSALSHTMLLCSTICLCVFFSAYFLKKQSLLIPAALIFFGISRLLTVFVYLRMTILYSITLSQEDYWTWNMVLLSVIGLLSFITGILHYHDSPRSTLRGFIAVTFAFTAIQCMLPAFYELEVTLYAFFPLLLMSICTLYLFTANPYAPATDAVGGSSATEWRCTCGRIHASFVSSCVCGVSKRDIVF